MRGGCGWCRLSRQHPSTMVHLYVVLLLFIIIHVQSWAPEMSKSLRDKPFFVATTPAAITTPNAKETFLESLDSLDHMNHHKKNRTKLLQDMLDNKVELPVDEFVAKNDAHCCSSIENPGSMESMQAVAEGTWKVIYAPHMTIMANLAGGGTLDVSYILNRDGTMISHAVCDFDWLLPNIDSAGRVILSVSGTWGSVSSQTCRVDFDQAWVTLNEEEPYATFDAVPEAFNKSAINFLGRLFFIEAVSVFPISFLDENLIVFDFELLGTRICARKMDVS